MRCAFLVLIVSLTANLSPVGSCEPAPAMDGENSLREAISNVLNQLHGAASKADGERYFALFAPDAVFLGTDATERWTIEEFRAYAAARFATGVGWTYTLRPGTRHINIAGDIAWFDELLDNAKYGTCRGSGVLQKIAGDWRIAQYNLTFTVPNDAAAAVVAVVRRHQESH